MTTSVVEDQDKDRNDNEYKEKEDFNIADLILELEFLFTMTNCSADIYYVKTIVLAVANLFEAILQNKSSGTATLLHIGFKQRIQKLVLQEEQ